MSNNASRNNARRIRQEQISRRNDALRDKHRLGQQKPQLTQQPSLAGKVKPEPVVIDKGFGEGQKLASSRGGRAAKGAAWFAAAELILKLVEWGLKEHQEAENKKFFEAKIQSLKKEMENDLKANPSHGLLLVNKFSGDQLTAVWFVTAPSEFEATEAARRRFIHPEVARQYSPMPQWNFRWFPPRHGDRQKLTTEDWRMVEAPFPKVGLGRWELGHEELIKVMFTKDKEAPFNEQSETSRTGKWKIPNPDEFLIEFLVMAPPNALRWRDDDGNWISGKIPIRLEQSGTGQLLNCVDLDSTFFDPGDAVAVPILPLDEALRAYVPVCQTRSLTPSLIAAHPGVENVIWAWPGDIELVDMGEPER